MDVGYQGLFQKISEGGQNRTLRQLNSEWQCAI